MDVGDLLGQQLKATFDEDDWFVAIRSAIRGVTADQAAWKRDGIDHSILETVTHLNFYNERHLRRLRGEEVEEGPERIAETFFSGGSSLETAWRREKARFARVMTGWIELVPEARGSSGDKSRRGRGGKGNREQAPWVPVLTHLTLHNAYHCGQIVMIRKLQGSWNPARGIR